MDPPYDLLVHDIKENLRPPTPAENLLSSKSCLFLIRLLIRSPLISERYGNFYVSREIQLSKQVDILS